MWKGAALFGTAGVMLLFALFLLLVSAWDLMAYNRTLKPGSQRSNPLSVTDAPDTRELPPRRTTPAAVPASVTETTTRHLDPARTKDGQ